jgi:hypothetical protein
MVDIYQNKHEVLRTLPHTQIARQFAAVNFSVKRAAAGFPHFGSFPYQGRGCQRLPTLSVLSPEQATAEKCTESWGKERKFLDGTRSSKAHWQHGVRTGSGDGHKGFRATIQAGRRRSSTL